MKASVLIGSRKSNVVDVPVPDISDDEVLLRVSMCGVCASEVQPWLGGAGNGKRILGHEAVGVVEEVGKNVVGFKRGSRVTGLIGQAFAEYAKAHHKDLVHVPDELTDKEAIGEPLSCLISGANRTPVTLGEKVAVIGTGFMGLGFMQLMHLKGASQIIAIDVRDESLSYALKFGASMTMKPNEVPDMYKVVQWQDLALDRGIPVVAEVTGTQAGLDLAADMTSGHGVLSVVGYHQKDGGMRSVNMQMWNWKAITVVNAHERRNSVHVEAMKHGLSLIREGKFNMKDLVTHELSLDEVDAAYTAILEKPKGFIKSVIRVS